MARQKTPRICANGHRFFKSSDCPTCPECEKAKASSYGLIANLPAPARRALDNAGIKTLKELSSFTSKEILKLHGMGPASLPLLQAQLQQHGLTFKKEP